MPSAPRVSETNELPMSAGNRHPIAAGASLEGLVTRAMGDALSAQQVGELLCLAGSGTYHPHPIAPRWRTNNPYAIPETPVATCMTIVQVQNIAKQEGTDRTLVKKGVEMQVGAVLRAILALAGSDVAITKVEMVREAKHFLEFSVLSTGVLPLIKPGDNVQYPVLVDRLGVYSFVDSEHALLNRYVYALSQLPQKTRHYLADRLPVQCVRIKTPHPTRPLTVMM